MYQNNSENCNSSNDPIRSRLNDENTEIVIDDTDNEDEMTSSGISEDEDEEEEINFQEGKTIFFEVN